MQRRSEVARGMLGDVEHILPVQFHARFGELSAQAFGSAGPYGRLPMRSDHFARLAAYDRVHVDRTAL
jgi:hypothetical protein